MHQTDRVKLQFGIPQEIPQQPMDMRGYPKLSLKKVVDTSWELQWSYEIAIWVLRHEHVLNDAMRFEVEVKPDYNYLSWFRATLTPFVSSNQQLQDPRVVELMPTTYPSPPSPPQQHTEVFHTPHHLSQPQYHMDTSNPYTYPQTPYNTTRPHHHFNRHHQHFNHLHQHINHLGSQPPKNTTTHHHINHSGSHHHHNNNNNILASLIPSRIRELC
ncbi:UDP-arabinose 4-epimerase [Trifolium repens]|nr:UDP-arabinose 4-epimerase [Trifolium repens]